MTRSQVLILSCGLLLTRSAYANPCDGTLEAVSDEQAATLGSFLDMEVAVFRVRLRQVEEAVECLDVPIAVEVAAELYRLEALGAFLDRDMDGATVAFGAAKALEPNTKLSEVAAPSGHPIDKLWTAAHAAVGEVVSLDVPEGGEAWVDGRAGSARPFERPTVVQLLDPDGLVVESNYLIVGATNPDWSHHVFTLAEPEPVLVERGHSGRLVLGLVAGGAALVSSGLYANAASTRANFLNPNTPYKDLDKYRRQTNGLAAASGAFGLGALGLGVASIAVQF